ncbi:unnamed protein product [Parajaminaea phylloscopi]
MKSFATLAAFVAVAASAVNAATVNSPASLIQCQPAAIQWNDAAAGDVYLSVVKGKDISGPALETFPTQSGTSGSYTWKVDQPAGTELTFIVNDSTGKQNYSSQVTVNAGSDSSCLNGAAAAAGGASSTASSSPASAATSASSAAGSKASSASRSGSSAAAAATSSAASSGNNTSGASFAAANGLAVAAAGVAAGFFLA